MAVSTARNRTARRPHQAPRGHALRGPRRLPLRTHLRAYRLADDVDQPRKLARHTNRPRSLNRATPRRHTHRPRSRISANPPPPPPHPRTKKRASPPQQKTAPPHAPPPKGPPLCLRGGKIFPGRVFGP